MTTTANYFLHLVWVHLASYTTDPEARTCLLRMAKVRGVTGGPVHGWHA